ncbi:hypothetical protein BC829DRAFT_447627 [Chytridium lagenaria]|nr:hypothetical protein BC829DRAFT_447627 [Chytridium lagenaria]
MAVTNAAFATVVGPNTTKKTIRVTPFDVANGDPQSLLHKGWFRQYFRCNKETFDAIAAVVERPWSQVNPVPHWNAYFPIRKRFAVINVLVHVRQEYIKLTTYEEWQELARGFEEVAGFPDATLAVDALVTSSTREVLPEAIAVAIDSIPRCIDCPIDAIDAGISIFCFLLKRFDANQGEGAAEDVGSASSLSPYPSNAPSPPPPPPMSSLVERAKNPTIRITQINLAKAIFVLKGDQVVDLRLALLASSSRIVEDQIDVLSNPAPTQKSAAPEASLSSHPTIEEQEQEL